MITENLPRWLPQIGKSNGAQETGLLHQQWYGDLLEQSEIGLWIFGASGETIYVSNAIAARLGYSHEEMFSLPIITFTGEDVLAQVRADKHRCRQEAAESHEVKLLHRDGSDVWADLSSIPAVGQQGEFLGNICILVDVTDRKRFEQSLRDGEDRYRSILENIQDGYYECDLTGKVVFCNGALCRIHGFDKEAIFGVNYLDYVTPETGRRIYQAFNQVYRTGEALPSFEVEFVNPDGTTRYVEESVSLMRDAEGQAIGFRGIVRDTTERKQAEEAMRQSEERYRTILENIHDGYYETDLTGQLTFVNDGLVKMFGAKSKEKLLGLNMRRFADEENARQLRLTGNQVYRTGESVSSFVYEVSMSDGSRRDVDISLSLIKTEGGQPIGFRGIIRDITDRKRVEALNEGQVKVLELIATGAPLRETLEAIVELFEKLCPNTICSILLLDEDGVSLRHGAARSLPEVYVLQLDGLKIGPQVGSCGTAAYTGQMVTVTDIAEDPSWADFRELALPHGLRACWSVPIFSNTRQVLGTFAVYYLVVGTPISQEVKLVGTLAHLASIAIERARAEEKLQASEARFRAMIEKSGEGISLIGANDTIIYSSPSIKRILGFEPHQNLGKAISERVHPGDLPMILQAKEALLRKPGQTETLIYRAGHKDGSWRWLEATTTNLLHDPNVQAIVVNFRDITERKETEDALRVSEERFAKAFNASPQPMAILDLPDRRYTNINEALVLSSGWAKDELIGRTSSDLNVWVNPDHPRQVAELLARQGFVRNMETNFRTKDGEIRDFLYSAEQIVLDGKPHVLIVANDITERNRAEAALRQNEALLHSVIESNPDWIFVKDRAHRYKLVNQTYASSLHLQEQDFIGKNDLELGFPEEQVKGNPEKDIRGFWADDREVFETGRSKFIEEEPVELDGQTHLFNTFKVPLFDVDDKVWGVLGVGRDITELRRAEADLRASEERFAKAFDASPQPMVIFNATERRVVNVNEAMVRTFGWAAEEMIGRTPEDLNFWVDPEQQSEVRTLLAAQGFVRDLEIKFRTKSGEIREFFYGAETINLNNQLHVLVVASDITERVRAKRALQESEERYRLLFEQSFAGIALTKLDGSILDCNDALAQIFGYQSRQEMLRFKATDTYYDQKHRKQLVAELKRRGNLRNRERLMKRKDGSEIWTLSNISLINKPYDSEPVIESVILDITERKLIEQELAQSHEQLRAFSARLETVREEERTHISREIHDNLGQLMTGLKLDFSWLEKRLTRLKDEKLHNEMKPKFGEIAELLEDTIQTVRNIASDLRPGVLDTLGLRAAIDWQVRGFKLKTGVKCSAKLCQEPKDLPPERATALFRILQEILTNITRHSNATHVKIEMTKTSEEIRLAVSDDGSGITEEQVWNPKSLGLLGMRERAMIYSGSVTITGERGSGTTVKVRMPIKNKNGQQDSSQAGRGEKL